MSTKYRKGDRLSFELMVKDKFEQAMSAGRSFADITAQRHNESWQNRFGNLELQSDESNSPGTAPALAPATIARKGHDLPLIDETLAPPHLKDSLFVRQGAEVDIGALHARYTSYSLIQNRRFPLNEWPAVNSKTPTRRTLGPTNEEIAHNFNRDLADYMRDKL